MKKKNDKKIAVKFKLEKKNSIRKNMFFKPKIETAPRVGIDNKKEIFDESYLL